MTTIPVTILDNFFDNPDTLRDWGLSLEYKPDPEGRFPGKRTECLSLINTPLYEYLNAKVFSLFFENLIPYECNLYFQLIEGYQGDGWIHQDSDVFTFIIYLSPENEINCGTSLYNLKPNVIFPGNSFEGYNIVNLIRNHYKTKYLSPEIKNIKDQYHESAFNKTLDIKDKYNRLLCFSSELHHNSNDLTNNETSRLTLIGFVRKLHTSNLPIIRSKQTIMG
tara:strand:- start:9 stop:674 length:666 start_codon:yes stop_codon:yes gene_type:complete